MADKASLSARRAWIEMLAWYTWDGWQARSLSARRAWIEIISSRGNLAYVDVALRKESVDRNLQCV